jgi:peptidoglycan hydrolase-like protein with peptidoglycan-binding domain
MHWTANEGKGADAVANRNYFNSTNRGASAHYIVDDHQIIQCIPDDEVAWHVGASKYRTIGEMVREKPFGPNYFLIGIEMCVNRDGDWSKTYRNSIELVAYLLKKYNLTINNIYRHFDITGKDCPKMMIEESDWTTFKNDVLKVMSGEVSKNKPVQEPINKNTEVPLLKRTLKLTEPIMSGEDIRMLQKRLNELNFNSGSVDGYFGNSTVSAVKSFQKSIGLSIDGIVGTKTWDALWKSIKVDKTNPSQYNEVPELKRVLKLTNPTMKGEDVKTLQTRLIKLKYSSGVADGIFGKNTEGIVKDFQKSKGLLVDGVVGPETWKALFY